ncbi:latrophilin Cirl-like isoform X2 [Tachypleus tridentatus]|uniref:latrophilin Cirl-like isoform X2 n=1 Tax=Tachypleus tridentatus TaxID=6853 RepID=UPI003FD42D4E
MVSELQSALKTSLVRRAQQLLLDIIIMIGHQRRPWTVLFVFAGLIFGVETWRGEQQKYRTIYACEGRDLRITCEAGHLIKLIRANYGRFSISICNEQGTLDWSVKCTSRRSYHVMHERCNLASSCGLKITSAIFGNPCPGTHKYLEVHYRCVLEITTSSTTTMRTTTTSTTTTRPPIIIPVTHNSYKHVFQKSSTTTTTTLKPPTLLPIRPKSTRMSTSFHPTQLLSSVVSTPGISTFTGHTVTTSTHNTMVQLYTKPPRMFHNTHTLPSGSDRKEFCAPTIARNILWNWTYQGEVAIQHCPGGSTGRSRWQCGSNPPRWVGSGPDLSECQSAWIENLKTRIDSGSSVVGIAAELAVITRTKPLYGGDITQTLVILQRLVTKLEDRVPDIKDEKQRYQVIREMFQSVQEVSSNLLEEFQNQSWQDLPASEQRVATSALIQRLEQSIWLLANSQSYKRRFSRTESNILVSVRLVETWSVSAVRFPVPEDIEGTRWYRMEDSILLPAAALLGSAINGFVKVMFVAYNRVEEFLSLEENLPLGIEGTASSPNSLLNSTQIVNSRVLSASVQYLQMVKLHQPVSVTLRHLQEENMSSPRCVFWDFYSSQWSTEGCWVRKTNITHTLCSCNHLTNFAVVMEITESQTKTEGVAFRIVITVGCAFALLFLLLTFVVLQFLRNLQGVRNTIHKNISLCLFLTEVVFVGGIDQITNRIACGIIAGLLHYFLLVVFAWTFLESFQLFLMVLDVFKAEKTRWKWWYYSLGYGLPVIVVGVSVVIDPYSYGTLSFCWLNIKNYYVFSFVGPTLAFVVASITFYFLILCKVCYKAQNALTIKSKEETGRSSVRMWCREDILILLVLSLTWSLALWFLLEGISLSAYLFTVLNCLQGLLIFIFFCLRDPEVRKVFWKNHHQNDWLPNCCQKSKTHDSQPSLYVHTNGLMSTAPIPSISGHHSLPHLSWRLLKDHQTWDTSSAIVNSITPDLPFIPMVGLQTDDLCLRNWLSASSYRTRNQGERGVLVVDQATFVGDSSSVDNSPFWENPRKKINTTINRLQQREIYSSHSCVTSASRIDHVYDTVAADSLIKHNNPLAGRNNDEEFSQHENRSIKNMHKIESVSKYCDHALESSAMFPSLGTHRTHHLGPLFPKGYLHSQVFYSGISSPMDLDLSDSSLEHERYEISSSVSPDLDSSFSVDVQPDSQVLQSLPNLYTSEGRSAPTFPHMLKYPSDNTFLNPGHWEDTREGREPYRPTEDKRDNER